MSLRERLLDYYRRNQDVWIPSGKIQRLVADKTKYSPSNATRRLRELAEEELLEVKHIKNHAWYRYVPQKKTIEEVEIVDNQARLVKREVVY